MSTAHRRHEESRSFEQNSISLIFHTATLIGDWKLDGFFFSIKLRKGQVSAHSTSRDVTTDNGSLVNMVEVFAIFD